MASIIRIKRSTGTTAPNLAFGELGLTVGAGTQGNAGDRVFVGDNASNSDIIGGKYFTDMMSHVAGSVASATNLATASNGFVAILDQNRKVDQWNVDNITIDGNTISSSNSNGDIILDPTGDGDVIIVDNTDLSFGTGEDGSIRYNSTSDIIEVSGVPWQWNTAQTFGNVGISSNVISTKSGAGNQLFIDPFPDGLSNEGTVIIKGDLQVDGTTTTVDSSSVTINDAILNIGDVTSNRTVTAPVNSGVSTITLDSVVGINTGDQIAVSGIDASGIATVTTYNSTSKVVTFQGTTNAGITTTTQVVITHGFDTNTDRGISFNYNTSGSGTQTVANNEIGFFGMDDSAIVTTTVGIDNHGTHGTDNSRKFVYVPDATITGNTVSGTKGFLDVKGIYYQSADVNTGGVSYFDSDGLLRSTNAPANASTTRTSSQILTAVTEITLALPSTLTVTAGDQITQQGNAGVQGVVKSDSNGTTVTLIGVEGTFNTSADLIRNGTGTSVTPDTVTTVYRNKPMWTNTVDGGTF